MPARKILQRYIRDVEVLELKRIFTNALDALDYFRDNPVDLLFLDIHLPRLSGIDFLSILDQKPYVILTTAFPDYALQGYELDVVDYLLKPFSFERFIKSVLKVQRQMDKIPTTLEIKKPESILVKIGYDMVKIQLDEIVYIQADGDYTTIFCMNKKHHASYSLKHWTDTLPQNQFIQVHRSFVVNVLMVDKISSSSAETKGAVVPLGRVYKNEFQEAFFKIRK